MLSIFTAVLGFASPFLPELLKYFHRKQDNAHEIALMDLRLRAGAQEHLWRMEEVVARADIVEAKEVRRPQKIFGVELLDHVKDKPWPIWLPVFWGLSLLDWLTGMVRPTVAYASFGFYIAYKWAQFQVLTGPRFETDVAGAIVQLWGEQDWNILVLILSYWFGSRAAKTAFRA